MGILHAGPLRTESVESKDTFLLEGKSFKDVCFIIEQSWLEVLNGLGAKRIVFIHSAWSIKRIEQYIKRCKDTVLEKPFIWNIYSFVIEENNQVVLLSFYKNQLSKNISFNIQDYVNNFSTLNILEQAELLIKTSKSNKKLLPINLEFLKNIANQQTITISTLASELLTENGFITVPRLIQNQIKPTRDKTETKTTYHSGSEKMFEDKIDVHAYNYFEIVHPAYAKQSVEIARLIKNYFDQSRQEMVCIDVGTGPGTPLQMLLEMLPNLKVYAVEPSELAFAYLKKNLKNKTQVNAEKINFLELEIKKQVPLVMSTGASHHFNTHFFFQKTWKVLKDGGLFLVADEFISPFQSEVERKRNLILHHTFYILALMFEIPFNQEDDIFDDEFCLMEWFKHDIPLASYFAWVNNVNKAIYICRDLLARCHKLGSPNKVSNPLMAFYRLQLLELEALVAGLDYEVEQKTYLERFVQMAESVGFSLVYHSRIYPTFGDRAMDAGTHVFAFRKVDTI